MNHVLCTHETRVATIRVIADPGQVDTLSSLADFKLVMSSMYRPPEIIHFQLNIKIPPVGADRAAHAAAEVLTGLREVMKSVEFMKYYDAGMDIGKNAADRRVVEKRLRSTIERMLRFNAQPSMIRANVENKGACTMELRLPRGMSLRCNHVSLAAEIEREGRPPTGHMYVDGQKYVYTVWTPHAVAASTISFEVLQKAVEEELTAAFPFLNMEGFEMIQERSLDGLR